MSVAHASRRVSPSRTRDTRMPTLPTLPRRIFLQLRMLTERRDGDRFRQDFGRGHWTPERVERLLKEAAEVPPRRVG